MTLNTQSTLLHTLTFIADVTSIRNEELISITLKSHVCCILIKLRRSFIFEIIVRFYYRWFSFSLNGDGKSISALFSLWLILMMQKPEMQAIHLWKNGKSSERSRSSTITIKRGQALVFIARCSGNKERSALGATSVKAAALKFRYVPLSLKFDTNSHFSFSRLTRANPSLRLMAKNSGSNPESAIKVKVC